MVLCQVYRVSSIPTDSGQTREGLNWLKAGLNIIFQGPRLLYITLRRQSIVASLPSCCGPRSISACKYAFELVYGHWSAHIRGAGEPGLWDLGAGIRFIYFPDCMTTNATPWCSAILGELLLMAWLTRFAAGAATGNQHKKCSRKN